MSKSKKKSQKTPRLKAADRTKILDLPDLLVVHPHTKAAHMRYGHKTKWCTATSNTNHWKNETRSNFLIYILMYDVDEKGNRVGDAKYKLAIQKSKRSAKAKWTVYDQRDSSFDYNAIKMFLDEKYDFTKKLDEYIDSIRRPISDYNYYANNFSKGDVLSLEGISRFVLQNTPSKSRYQRKLYNSRYNHNTGGYTHKLKRKLPEIYRHITCEVEYSTVKKAVVIEKNKATLKLRLLEISDTDPILKFFMENYDPVVTFRPTKENCTVIAYSAVNDVLPPSILTLQS